MKKRTTKQELIYNFKPVANILTELLRVVSVAVLIMGGAILTLAAAPVILTLLAVGIIPSIFSRTVADGTANLIEMYADFMIKKPLDFLGVKMGM